jgi:hypothetical protein
MAYNIIHANGTSLTTIADGDTNTSSTSLTLIGRNVATYGEALNNNLVHLLENYANSTAPSNPINGQLWYDTSNNQLKFFNGGWNGISTLTKSATTPFGLTNGDFWYDTTNSQIKFFNGATSIVVAPLTNVTITGDCSGTGSFSGASSVSVGVTLTQDRLKLTGGTLTGQLNASNGLTAGVTGNTNILTVNNGGVGVNNSSPVVSLDVIGAIRNAPIVNSSRNGSITLNGFIGTHQVNLTGNAVFNFTNFGNIGQTMKVIIVGTNFNMVWPNTVYFPGGIVPDLASGIRHVAIVELTVPSPVNAYEYPNLVANFILATVTVF